MSSVRSSASSMPLAAPSFLILSAAALVGRKSPTAAAMTRTSQRSKRLRAASASSEAVSTSTYSIPAWRGSPTLAATHGHRGAAACGLLGQREAHAAGGAVADEAHRVDRLAGAAGGDQHAHARERRPGRGRPSHNAPPPPRAASGGSGSRPAPHSPREPSAPVPGLEHVDAARAQGLDVGLGRRVLPHVVVHRRRHEQRATRGQGGGGERGCRPGRWRAWPACWPRRARSRRRRRWPPARGGRAASWSGGRWSGKAPRAGSGSNSSTSTGAPVMAANDARADEAQRGLGAITRTAWPCTVARRASSSAL